MLYRYLDFFYLDDYTNKEVYDCSQYKSSYFHLKNGCNEHLKKRFNSYSISIKHFSFFVFLFLFLILHFCNKMLKLTLKQFHEHCYDRSFTLFFFFFIYLWNLFPDNRRCRSDIRSQAKKVEQIADINSLKAMKLGPFIFKVPQN